MILNEQRLNSIIKEAIDSVKFESRLQELGFYASERPHFNKKYRDVLNRGQHVFTIECYYNNKNYINTFVSRGRRKIYDVAYRISDLLSGYNEVLDDNMSIECWFVEDGSLVSDTCATYVYNEDNNGMWID